MSKFCNSCGAKNSDSSQFCEECGSKLEFIAESASQKNRYIIIALLVIIIALLGGLLYMVVSTPAETPLVKEDFEIFTMLVPEGSYFVETSSMPSYGFGGFVYMKNIGNYSREVGVLGVSTTQGDTHPSEVSLISVDGDIRIFKDNQGNDAYYITRDVGEYDFTLMGNDEAAMVKMLKSIEITD